MGCPGGPDRMVALRVGPGLELSARVIPINKPVLSPFVRAPVINLLKASRGLRTQCLRNYGHTQSHPPDQDEASSSRAKVAGTA